MGYESNISVNVELRGESSRWISYTGPRDGVRLCSYTTQVEAWALDQVMDTEFMSRADRSLEGRKRHRVFARLRDVIVGVCLDLAQAVDSTRRDGTGFVALLVVFAYCGCYIRQGHLSSSLGTPHWVSCIF